MKGGKFMKRYIAMAIAVLMLFSVCVIPISAIERDGTCNGNHGPWIILCSGDTYTESRSHYFDYYGYTKLCNYDYVIAYTNRKCDYCKQLFEHVWTHSHGYSNHAADCGWTNGDDTTCYLH